MGTQALPGGSLDPSAVYRASVPLCPWWLEVLAGRFVEVGGGPATAGLTLCARLMAQAQRERNLAAWVGTRGSVFYPPDLSAAGVDLAALVVVRAPDVRGLWRACDTLLRSGGFKLVVADVQGEVAAPFAAQTRLGGLAQRNHATLIALTRQSRREGPRGSLVSLRAETEKRRIGHDGFLCRARVVKDKRRAPGWTHEEWCRGTDGLC